MQSLIGCGVVELHHVSTAKQVAAVFTKPMNLTPLRRQIKALMNVGS